MIPDDEILTDNFDWYDSDDHLSDVYDNSRASKEPDMLYRPIPLGSRKQLTSSPPVKLLGIQVNYPN